MDYYKLVDGYPVLPPESLVEAYRIIFNYRTLIETSADIRENKGYYPVVGEAPEYNKYTHKLTTTYTQGVDHILASYSLTELTETEIKLLYKEELVELIMGSYDSNDEIDLLNTGLEDPDDAEYTTYRQFVDECKEIARVKVYGT